MRVSEIELYDIEGSVDLAPEEGSVLMGVLTEKGVHTGFRTQEVVHLGTTVTLYGLDQNTINALRNGKRDVLDRFVQPDQERQGVYRFAHSPGILAIHKGVLGENATGSIGLLEVKEYPPYSPTPPEEAHLASVQLPSVLSMS